MKFTVTLVVALATTAAAFGSAQAKLTPFDGAREATVTASLPAVVASTSAASTNERTYFNAPQAEATQAPGRCTVHTFVFAKTTLAEACY